MRILTLLVLVLCSQSGALRAADDKPVAVDDPRLQQLYRDEAKRWEMWVDPQQERKAEMVPEPVFRWQNLDRPNGQSGAMYVWVFEGRPAAIGGVFSDPVGTGRNVMHEFHALAPNRLYPVLTGSAHKWAPRAGITMQVLPDSPPVESTAAKRTLQLRSIARDFTARETDPENKRWEMRVLPKPLYRCEKPQGDLIDGALIAFVSDTGTDPEIILILEARRKTSGETAWYYQPVRLSISDLYLDYKGNRVWSSMRSDLKKTYANEDETYHLWRDRVLADLPSE
jgi:hypothetical protein